ncbi:MAG TPA: chemotaxis protein CheW [Methylophilaceae bacterium]|nr:chemotaxis protein CheW [Methylophilaceae bacterium]
MAKKKLNLQAYQQDILARLKNLAEGGREASSTRLGVKIGNVSGLVSLMDISEVLPVPEIIRVPLTHSWFMGMANVRGNLYALTDLAHFIGGDARALTHESRILLVHQRFGVNAGLLVDQLIGLRSINEMQVQKHTKDMQAWQLAQYKDASGQDWVELDLAALLGQKEFMQIAA